jgi:hypothetical protein
VRISIHLPDNESPCDTHARVVRSSTSGQIGLQILKPDSFRRHFETWHNFATQTGNTAYVPSQPQTDREIGVTPEQSCLDLEGLRAAILEDVDADSHLSIFKRTGIIAVAAACLLLVAGIWVWYIRANKASTNVQESGIPSAEATPVAVQVPQNLPQTTSEPDPRPRTYLPAVPMVSGLAQGNNSAKPVVIPTTPAKQHASHARIVINVSRFSRIKPKLLQNPDRIYFDLSPGTRVDPSSVRRAEGNRLVRRIRVGHAQDGHTRLVLDLQRRCDYQARITKTAPYQLIISLRTDRKRTS